MAQATNFMLDGEDTKSQEIHTAVTSNSRLNRIMTAESNSSFIGQRNESYEDRKREENMII